MPIYQVYVASDGSQSSMFQADTDVERSPQQQLLLTSTVDGVPMVLEATFYARNWRQAVKASNTILGLD